MEIIAEDETKVFVEYSRNQKVWRVEKISSNGFVHIDFPEKITKLLKNLENVDHITIRKKYEHEYV